MSKSSFLSLESYISLKYFSKFPYENSIKFTKTFLTIKYSTKNRCCTKDYIFSTSHKWIVLVIFMSKKKKHNSTKEKKQHVILYLINDNIYNIVVNNNYRDSLYFGPTITV